MIHLLWKEINNNTFYNSTWVNKENFTESFRDNVWYGYVAFFSTFDCEEALRQSGKIIIGNNRVKVKKKENTKGFKDHALSLHKSQELLTYYFGFNCWSSEIVHVIWTLVHCA